MSKAIRLFFVTLLLLIVNATNPLLSQERIIDRIVAIVGNNIIMQSDIEHEIRQLSAEGIRINDQTRCEILENMLIQKLLLNQAAIDSIEVSESDVEIEITQRLQMFIQRIGSEEALENYYSKSIIEIREDLRDPMREQLITQEMQREIIGNLRVTPAEVRRFFNNLPSEDIPMIPSEVEIRRVVKYPEFSEAEKFRVRQRLNEIRQRIINGESFTTMAVLYSDDSGSARRGGELGYLTRSNLVPEFATVAFSLRDDRVSQVFETEYGYHIAQLIDRRGDQANIRHILLQPKASDEAKEEAVRFLDSLDKVIRTDTLSFRHAAIIHSEDETTRLNGGLVINPFTGGSKFELDQLNPVQFEAVREMAPGEIRGPLESRDQQGRNFYKLLLLEAQTLPHPANLADDYSRIREMAVGYRRQQELQEWIAEKRKGTYIRIDNAFGNCQFSSDDWVRR